MMSGSFTQAGTTDASQTLLLVITGLAVGGAEMQTVEIAIRMQRLGWRVHVATLLPPGGLKQSLDEAGIPVHDLGMVRGRPDPRALLRLATLVRHIRPNVVHSHMVHANLLARLTRLLSPIPRLVCTVHSVHEGGIVRSIAYRLTDACADVTTAISQAAVQRHVTSGSTPANRIRLLPNGVDLARFRRNEELRRDTREALGVGDRFVWLNAARLDPIKNQRLLLEAVQQVPATMASEVLIAGAGPLERALRAQIDAARLNDRVRLLGLRRDIPALLAAADGFVLCSRWEGLPMVLLEAAAAGIPCIVTDVGGCAEAVRDGETGFVVPSDNAAALGTAMQRLMTMPPEARTGMGEAARQLAERHFDLDHIVAHWQRVYRGAA